MASNQQAADSNLKSINHVDQWVSRVLDFSSEYNQSTWAANNVVGPPQVYPNYGDLNFTWAQANDFTSPHFIELEFPIEIFVKKINIYETYHAGGVVAIKLKDKNSNRWITVWQSAVGAINIESSRIFSPELINTKFKTNQVRLELDCSVAASYCEIDAVEISGKKFYIDPVEAEKDLTDDLKRLLLSEEFTDVEIEVEGKLFKAHRNILTARSDQFKTLLCENLRQDRLNKPIHIENMTCKCFKALLNFFYTNELEENTEPVIACELIRVGFWYNLDDLRRVAFNFIQSKLSQENAIELIVCALDKEPVLDDVQEICLKFIAKNFSSLVNRAEFKRLPQHILVKITQFYAQFHK